MRDWRRRITEPADVGAASDQFEVGWVDHRRDAQCPPDSRFPEGVDIDARPHGDLQQGCRVDLPCPARRCGYYVVRCRTCGYAVAVTTAGRPDDPRSVTLPCQGAVH